MRIFIALTLFTLVSCQPGSPSTHASAPESPSLAAQPAGSDAFVRKVWELSRRMHARFTASQRMERAIALSDLPRAHEEAHVITTLAEPDVLPEWKPYVDSIIATAHQVELTGDTVAAAKMTALLGQRCSKCHEAINARVQFAKVPAPSTDGRLAADMANHQWAAARMWEGLIGPSRERWIEGAQVLTQAPLTIVAEGDLPPELSVADEVSRVRIYATQAINASTQDERANLYGELLGTCARCHYKIRDRQK